MAKVIIDIRHINKGGIGVYISEVFSRVFDSPNVFYLLVDCSYKTKIFEKKHNIHYLFVPPLFSIFEQVWFLFHYKLLKDSVYISPYLTFPLIKKSKLVYIVHDLIWLKYPHFATNYLGYLYFSIFLNMGVKFADHIIAISNQTKKDLLNRYNLDPVKIHVKYNGLNVLDYQDIKLPNVDFEYFIYVGNWKPWKNLSVLIEAFALFLLANTNKNVKLVLCGDNATNKATDIDTLIKYKCLKDSILVTGKVQKNILLGWINNSLASIQPSIDEGFGMGVSESLVLNVPTICNDILIFRELYSGYVEFFEQNSIEALKICLLNAYIKRKPRLKPSINYEILRKFDWSYTSSHIIKILENYT